MHCVNANCFFFLIDVAKKRHIFADVINTETHMTTDITLASVQSMSAENINVLINQLEEAMLTDMSYDRKVKLHFLIGKCIDIYISKK